MPYDTALTHLRLVRRMSFMWDDIEVTFSVSGNSSVINAVF